MKKESAAAQNQNWTMQADVLRSWWAKRQGLDGSLTGLPPAEILERAGWARSVAGVGPYLTLFSRGGTSREEADQAVADVAIHELPCARGCTYVVPASEYALALKVGHGFGDTGDMNVARKFLGVTDSEIDILCVRVIAALDKGPLDPAGLKKVVGDAVRNLGPDGKKRGITTTLPLALGRLQAMGEIRRKPINGRLDQQRYAYVNWKESPLEGCDLTTDEAFVELAKKYFAWMGAASLSHFQTFSGLSQKAAKAALAELKLVEAPGTNLLASPEDLDDLLSYTPPSEPQYRLVSSLDAIALHRRDVKALIDERDLCHQVFSDGKLLSIGHLMDLSSHAILDRGRIIGLWEYEVESASIVWWTFSPATDGLKSEIARTEAYVRDQLGDARSFSLDSPESRKPAIAALRAAATA